MADLSYAEFCLFDSIVGKETTEMLVCCECGRNFHKRENTKIDNFFCSAHCQDSYDVRRYYKVPPNKRDHIRNAAVIVMTERTYQGGYTE